MPIGTVEREASIVVCSTCRVDREHRETPDGVRGGELLFQALQRGSAERGTDVPIAIQKMPCFFACSRFCTIHLRAPGKIGYVMGDFRADDESVDAILTFFEAYRKSEKGIVPFRDWPEGVKGHFITRMPPEGGLLL
jgi:predicted metal-binding protein